MLHLCNLQTQRWSIERMDEEHITSAMIQQGHNSSRRRVKNIDLSQTSIHTEYTQHQLSHPQRESSLRVLYEPQRPPTLQQNRINNNFEVDKSLISCQTILLHANTISHRRHTQGPHRSPAPSSRALASESISARSFYRRALHQEQLLATRSTKQLSNIQ